MHPPNLGRLLLQALRIARRITKFDCVGFRVFDAIKIPDETKARLETRRALFAAGARFWLRLVLPRFSSVTRRNGSGWNRGLPAASCVYGFREYFAGALL